MCTLLLPGVEVIPEHTEGQHREKQQAHTVNHSPVNNKEAPTPIFIFTQGGSHFLVNMHCTEKGISY